MTEAANWLATGSDFEFPAPMPRILPPGRKKEEPERGLSTSQGSVRRSIICFDRHGHLRKVSDASKKGRAAPGVGDLETGPEAPRQDTEAISAAPATLLLLPPLSRRLRDPCSWQPGNAREIDSSLLRLSKGISRMPGVTRTLSMHGSQMLRDFCEA